MGTNYHCPKCGEFHLASQACIQSKQQAHLAKTFHMSKLMAEATETETAMIAKFNLWRDGHAGNED